LNKVQGWINCDYLELEASRDGIYEGNEIYAEFIQKLIQYLDENYDRKSESKDKDVKSQRQLAKMFVSVVKSHILIIIKLKEVAMFYKASKLRYVGSGLVHV
jgi:hypothetical protein